MNLLGRVLVSTKSPDPHEVVDLQKIIVDLQDFLSAALAGDHVEIRSAPYVVIATAIRFVHRIKHRYNDCTFSDLLAFCIN